MTMPLMKSLYSVVLRTLPPYFLILHPGATTFFSCPALVYNDRQPWLLQRREVSTTQILHNTSFFLPPVPAFLFRLPDLVRKVYDRSINRFPPAIMLKRPLIVFRGHADPWDGDVINLPFPVRRLWSASRDPRCNISQEPALSVHHPCEFQQNCELSVSPAMPLTTEIFSPPVSEPVESDFSSLPSSHSPLEKF